MTNNIEHLIDFVLINLNKVKITAFAIFILSVLYAITGWWIVIAFIAIDFGVRAFKAGQFNLLNGISNTIIDFGSIETIPVNQAPKIFAARIGFTISFIILTAEFTGFSLTAQAIAGVLALFAFLESVKGFCAGCYLYSYYIRIIAKQKINNNAEDKSHQ